MLKSYIHVEDVGGDGGISSPKFENGLNQKDKLTAESPIDVISRTMGRNGNVLRVGQNE